MTCKSCVWLNPLYGKLRLEKQLKRIFIGLPYMITENLKSIFRAIFKAFVLISTIV